MSSLEDTTVGKLKSLDLTGRQEEDEDQIGGMRLNAGISVAKLASTGEGDLIDPVYEHDQEEELMRSERTYSSRYKQALLSERFNNLDISEGFEQLKTTMTEIKEGISVKTMIEGNGSEYPPARSCVTIHYELMIEGQDEPFDSSFIRGIPERFKLNALQLLPGFEVVIQSMRVGDMAMALFAPEHAYGDLGIAPRIPPNCEVLAVIKLLNLTLEGEAEKLLEDMDQTARLQLPWQSILTAASAEHRTGNHFAGNEEWSLAISHYNFAIKILEERTNDKKNNPEEWNTIAEKLYLNKAHCHLNQNQPKKALDLCRKALKINSKSLKGNFRMAKACLALDMLTDAREHLTLAHQLEPDNILIEQELSNLNKKILEINREELRLCRNIFANVAKIKKEERKENLDQSQVFTVLQDVFDDLKGRRMELCLPAFPSNCQVLKSSAHNLNLNLRLTSDNPQKVIISSKQT